MSTSSATWSEASGRRTKSLVRLGLRPDKWDTLIALAGNPNVGKSTVFNALTGLRQHTGNWPGKTIVRAEGGFVHRDKKMKVVDLPGTYSLQAGSVDEEVARDFILFGQPDVTVVVVDATRLERNLNLVLQILDITDRVVLFLNLMDEARRHGIAVDSSSLERQLGVPVVSGIARSKIGIDLLLETAHKVGTGQHETNPYRITQHAPKIEKAVTTLANVVEKSFPGIPSSRWVSQRLLNADGAVVDAVQNGELGQLGGGPRSAEVTTTARRKTLDTAQRLRWELPSNFHDSMTENIYEAAQEIAEGSQLSGLRKASFDFDRVFDRALTSRWLGFPVMLLILSAVFWLTIEGANVPSAMLGTLLIDTIHPALKMFGVSVGLAADGDFLSTVHFTRRFWVPSSSRI